ncbi:hypothetical protein [Shewanella colwelliana]|uniref:hypothetical protein n=1 Tax=Shewanella colwelliana TaxID=23 RepID=UPI0022B03B57|nr:hypothetical protein [Shewanella colwelliana]MCZ4337712.1 hypothetical protein [Shewanella colwelliana]
MTHASLNSFIDNILAANNPFYKNNEAIFEFVEKQINTMLSDETYLENFFSAPDAFESSQKIVIDKINSGFTVEKCTNNQFYSNYECCMQDSNLRFIVSHTYATNKLQIVGFELPYNMDPNQVIIPTKPDNIDYNVEVINGALSTRQQMLIHDRSTTESIALQVINHTKNKGTIGDLDRFCEVLSATGDRYCQSDWVNKLFEAQLIHDFHGFNSEFTAALLGSSFLQSNNPNKLQRLTEQLLRNKDQAAILDVVNYVVHFHGQQALQDGLSLLADTTPETIDFQSVAKSRILADQLESLSPKIPQETSSEIDLNFLNNSL